MLSRAIASPITAAASVLVRVRTRYTMRGQVYDLPPSEPPMRALRPTLDGSALEAEYLSATPHIVTVDDLLAPEALAAVQRWIRSGTFHGCSTCTCQSVAAFTASSF